MRNFNASVLEDMKKVYNDSMYIKREWITNEEYTLTLEEFSSLINPTMKHVIGNPIVVSKAKKKGGSFLKLVFPLDGGSVAEYDLSYEEKGLSEGDELDLDTLLFKTEIFLNEKHGYATGDVA